MTGSQPDFPIFIEILWLTRLLSSGGNTRKPNVNHDLAIDVMGIFLRYCLLTDLKGRCFVGHGVVSEVAGFISLAVRAQN